MMPYQDPVAVLATAMRGQSHEENVKTLREVVAIVKVKMAAAGLENTNSSGSVEEARIRAHFILAAAESELVDVLGIGVH